MIEPMSSGMSIKEYLSGSPNGGEEHCEALNEA